MTRPICPGHSSDIYTSVASDHHCSVTSCIVWRKRYKISFSTLTSNFLVRNELKAWGRWGSVSQKCLLSHRWHHDFLPVTKRKEEGFLIWLFSDILQIKQHFPSLQTQVTLTKETAFMSGNLSSAFCLGISTGNFWLSFSLHTLSANIQMALAGCGGLGWRGSHLNLLSPQN